MIDSVTRRPATDDDLDLLRAIYNTTREYEMSIVDWNDEQKNAFLAMQFHAQHTYYHAQFPTAHYDILERDHVPIGRLYVDETHTDVNILDIAILPEYRNRGIGTALLQGMMDDAVGKGKQISLHVEEFNRARVLYERLGYTSTRKDGIYLFMTWNGHTGG